MKKVVLKHFSKSGNGYTISLGNGTVHTLPSKRQAADFLNKTNKFLTLQLFEVHGIYMAMWQEYQRCWFYFGHGTEKGRWGLHFMDKKKLDECFQDCEESLASCIDRSDYDMGNRMSFRNVQLSIHSLKQATKILLPLHKKRSSTADIYRLNSFISRLVEIENRINSYGQLEAVRHTSIIPKLKNHA